MSRDRLTLAMKPGSGKDDCFTETACVKVAMERLANFLRQRETGGDILFLVGPPGSGKTALMQHLQEAAINGDAGCAIATVAGAVGGIATADQMRIYLGTHINALIVEAAGHEQLVGITSASAATTALQRAQAAGKKIVVLFDNLDQASDDLADGVFNYFATQQGLQGQLKSFVDGFHVLFVFAFQDKFANRLRDSPQTNWAMPANTLRRLRMDDITPTEVQAILVKRIAGMNVGCPPEFSAAFAEAAYVCAGAERFGATVRNTLSTAQAAANKLPDSDARGWKFETAAAVFQNQLVPLVEKFLTAKVFAGDINHRNIADDLAEGYLLTCNPKLASGTAHQAGKAAAFKDEWKREYGDAKVLEFALHRMADRPEVRKFYCPNHGFRINAYGVRSSPAIKCGARGCHEEVRLPELPYLVDTNAFIDGVPRYMMEQGLLANRSRVFWHPVVDRELAQGGAANQRGYEDMTLLVKSAAAAKIMEAGPANVPVPQGRVINTVADQVQRELAANFEYIILTSDGDQNDLSGDKVLILNCTGWRAQAAPGPTDAPRCPVPDCGQVVNAKQNGQWFKSCRTHAARVNFHYRCPNPAGWSGHKPHVELEHWLKQEKRSCREKDGLTPCLGILEPLGRGDLAWDRQAPVDLSITTDGNQFTPVPPAQRSAP